MTAPTRNPNLPRSFVIGGDEAREYCSVHKGYVDEGRTRPPNNESPYRICSACETEQAYRHGATCPHCPYHRAIHDNRLPDSLLPFGCPPSEAAAIARWGGE